MNNIKPIETYYNGYRFRCRLEARWAVFFDVMNVRYLYENEGFKLNFDNGQSISYLPDFYFPEYDLYGEVKGAYTRGGIQKEEMEKISWFIDYGNPLNRGVIFLGNIPDPIRAYDMSYAIWFWNGEGLTWAYTWAHDDLTRRGYWHWHDTQSAPHHFEPSDDLILTTSFCLDDSCEIPETKVGEALRKARSARFEHGEQPII